MNTSIKLIILISTLFFTIISCGSKETSETKVKPSISSTSSPKMEQEAINVAKEWLSLLDSSKLDETWEQTADVFKLAIPKEQWNSTIKNIQLSFGKALSRELLSSKYYTSLPGAPDGEYVVIQFTTKFLKKEGAIETITPNKDDSGKWKVSGYYIK